MAGVVKALAGRLAIVAVVGMSVLTSHVPHAAAAEPHAPSYAGRTYLRAEGGVQAARDWAWRRLGATQWRCLDILWQRESGWRVRAGRVSGSYGIPQAYPGTRMRSAGPDWRDSAMTQVRWGLAYIGGRYGTPCRALAHSDRWGWY